MRRGSRVDTDGFNTDLLKELRSETWEELLFWFYFMMVA